MTVRPDYSDTGVTVKVIKDCNGNGAPDPDEIVDDDGDNVGNGCDNCPGRANAGQEDEDEDQVGDVCDNCESIPNGPALGWCVGGLAGGACSANEECDTAQGAGDGVCLMAQDDADGDGFGDACDRCPGSDDAVDDDNDGVPDGCDNCTLCSNGYEPRPPGHPLYDPDCDCGTPAEPRVPLPTCCWQPLPDCSVCGTDNCQACGFGTEQQLENVRDRAGNVLEVYEYDSETGWLTTKYKCDGYSPSSCEIETTTAYEYDTVGVRTRFVETPQDGSTGPRTTDLVYDARGNFLGSLSGECGCGDGFVFHDSRGRVQKVTVATLPPESALSLDEYDYVEEEEDAYGNIIDSNGDGRIDDRLKQHRRRVPDDYSTGATKMQVVETRSYVDAGDGSYTVWIHRPVDADEEEIRREEYNADGRLITSGEYKERFNCNSDPPGADPDYITHYTYDDDERLLPTAPPLCTVVENDDGIVVCQARETTRPSGVHEVWKWWFRTLDNDPQACEPPNECMPPYQAGSEKVVETYTTKEDRTETVNYRKETYVFRMFLGETGGGKTSTSTDPASQPLRARTRRGSRPQESPSRRMITTAPAV